MSEEVKSESAKKNEDWMNSKWRPMMGWLYMATCTFDFVIFPILWSLLQSVMGHPVSQWQPLTLQGAGLYHIAMGAVLGLAAFGRTQEKLAGANNGGASIPSPSFAPPPITPPMTPASTTVTTTYTPPVKPATPMVASSSTGKAMPIPAAEPEL